MNGYRSGLEAATERTSSNPTSKNESKHTTKTACRPFASQEFHVFSASVASDATSMKMVCKSLEVVQS
jgi:hypothetical protein